MARTDSRQIADTRLPEYRFFRSSSWALADLVAWGLALGAAHMWMAYADSPSSARWLIAFVGLGCWTWVGLSLQRGRRSPRARFLDAPRSVSCDMTEGTGSGRHPDADAIAADGSGNDPERDGAEATTTSSARCARRTSPRTVALNALRTRADLSIGGLASDVVAFDSTTSETASHRSSSPSRQVSIDISECYRRLNQHPDFDADLVEAVADVIRSTTTSAASTDLMTDLTGTTIGTYSLVRLIGVGGEGAVYECRSLGHGPTVAMKLLAKAEAYTRFRREMRLVQHLAHPNIVVCYDFGVWLDRPYYVMELLQGPNLQAEIRDHGPLRLDRALPLARQAASALQHAHQRGLVHCDVKPGNLVLHGGQIKLIDLGLAGLNTEFSSALEPRGTSKLAGTVGFMAPEQACGESSYGPATDVFGLGATLYFMLTGQSLVPGCTWRDKVSFLLGNEEVVVPAICGCPEHIRSLIARMTCRSPEARFPDMTVVVAALDRALAGLELRPRLPCPVRVLVVEDDEDDLYLTAQMLARANPSVDLRTASSLQAAVRVIESSARFDLILADLHLPDSRGVATIQKLASVSGAPRVVAMSILDAEEMAHPCLQAGAVDYICKHELTVRRLERTIFVTLSRVDSLPDEDE